MVRILKHPLTVVAGAFTALASLFNITAIDALAAYLWANIGQWFSMSALLATVGDPLPFNPGWIEMAVIVTGLAYFGKQLLGAVREMDRAVDADD